jgi:hypothetical protein
MDKPLTLRDVEARTKRLLADINELDRLDRAAGDPIARSLSIREYVSERMREAARAALGLEDKSHG